MSSEKNIKWDIDVSILTNRFILNELLKVLGIATLITAAIVALIMLPSVLSGNVHSTSSNVRDMKYALMLIGILFFFTVLFIFAYYSNKYMLTYNLDSKGVSTITRENQKAKNSKINFLLIFAGLLTGNPGAVGTGLLAASHQNQDIKWKKVKKATFYPKSKTIALKAGFAEKGIVFCTPANYESVTEYIKEMCNGDCRIKEK
ncbi:hypothetical protein [Methanolobus bombayensis]|uniref:hypothetical protein n=1 Tax=Methanolobus bombayensis TaxID=38023 RepID=UPI001AE3C2E4|nr:hypothetical protein [Methanolobus bombayensis]MBP1908028.1 hypothetical protein [Methanolobus bombayensis]